MTLWERSTTLPKSPGIVPCPITVAQSRSRETLAGRDRLASAPPPNESPATKVASSGRSPFHRGRVEHLHVSYKTVANTCIQLNKLGVRTLPELMRIAIQHLPSTTARSPK